VLFAVVELLVTNTKPENYDFVVCLEVLLNSLTWQYMYIAVGNCFQYKHSGYMPFFDSYF